MRTDGLVDVLYRIKDSVIAIDNNYNIIYVNQAHAKIYCLEPKEMVGKNVWKVAPKIVGTIVQQKLEEALRKKEVLTFEWEGIYDAKVWETTLYPSDDGVTAISRDISIRKKVEDDLRKNRELLNNIINSTDAVIIARDLDEKLILLNKKETKLYKMSEEEALGTTPYDIYPKEVAEQIIAWDKKVLGEGKSFRYEETILIDGLPCTFVTNKFPLFDSNGKIYGLGGVITDITRHKETETKLEEYSKNLERLVEERTKQLKASERLAAIGATAGMVGHDIRNPLQAIAGDLYLIDNDVASLPEGETKIDLQDSVRSIQDNLLYIAKIVEDLQDYAKQQKPNLQRITLNKVVEEVMLIVPVPSNLNVVIDIEEGFPNFFADFSMMKRALSNLVHNAIQAMPDGGRLTIQACCKDTHIFVTVEDTGVGIPEEVKPKLFQPMVTTKSKGQGLGLAVVKRLVEAQGGTIFFESEVGKGTKFIVKLPI